MDKKLKKNLSLQIIYQLLQIVAPLIIAPYISRVLGATNIGIYAYTYSIAYYFVMFAMLGLANYGSRTIALHDNDIETRSKTFWEIYILQLLCSIIIIIAYCVFLAVGNKDGFIIYLIQLLYVLSAMFDISWFYFGIEDVSPIVIRNSIIKLLTLIGIFTFVKNIQDLWVYTIILSGGQLFGNISMWLALNKKIKFIKVKFKNITKHFIPNFTLFIPVIAISLYKNMDKIMLGIITEKNQVGYYTNSENLINVPIGFVIALGSVMLPRITKLYNENKIDECKRYFKTSIRITMFFSSIMCFGIASVAPMFVPLYYGVKFYDCIPLLVGHSIIIFFIGWANVVRTQYLLPSKKEKEYIISIFCGAAFNLLLNFLLIPIFNAKGALIATIIAEFIVCIIQSIYTNSYINMFNCFKENIVFIIPGIVMLIVVRSILADFTISILSLLIIVAIGSAIYLIVLIILYHVFKKCYNKDILDFKINNIK